MKEIEVKNNQTFIDIAMQELGDASRAFEIAKLNNRSLTADLTTGEMILVPEPDLSKKSIVKMFKSKYNIPASGASVASEIEDLEGIGYWSIGDEFKVS